MYVYMYIYMYVFQYTIYVHICMNTYTCDDDEFDNQYCDSLDTSTLVYECAREIEQEKARARKEVIYVFLFCQ